MPAGDQTEIGDRGINLSGGQRQRVSIARALYADRDLIVFDDPLSAVDSHVAAHLVEQVVEGYIKKRGKTAVMVTNQLQFLKAADQVILLKDGKVAEQGNFHDLRANGKDFAQLVKDFGGIDSSDEDSPKHGTTQANPDLVSPPIAHTRSKKSSSKKSTKKTQDSKTTTTTTTTTTSGGLTSAEEIESGAVSASVYWYYIRAGGALWFLLSAFLMFGIAAIRVFHSLWISWWTNPDPAISGQYVKETCS
jgi:ABC-type methionine transport system ATPase subunit